MNTGARLQLFLDTINLSVHRFEVETGMSFSSALRVIKGEHEFSTANILRIHTRYPDLNLDWFLTGRGEMLVDVTQLDSSDYIKESIRLLEQNIKYRKEFELEILQSRETLEKQLLALKGEITLSHRQYN